MDNGFIFLYIVWTTLSIIGTLYCFHTDDSCKFSIQDIIDGIIFGATLGIVIMMPFIFLIKLLERLPIIFPCTGKSLK